MRPAIEAVRETGTTIAEVALCYTADLNDPDETLYTLDYYLRLAEQIVEAGAHVLAIKDMAGLLRPPAATKLVSALRERFDLPVHLHTHDTAGGQLATLLAAVDAGVDAVDVASRADGRHHQPAAGLGPGRRAGPHRARHAPGPAGGDGPGAVLGGGPQGLRALRVRAAESRPDASTTTRSPAASCPTCASRRSRWGWGRSSSRSRPCTRPPSRILGRPTKVTPSSKVVGDLALQLVAVGADPADFEENPQNYDIPDSVIGFLGGELGDPPGGWPEPFRTKALQGRSDPGPRRSTWPRRTPTLLDEPGQVRQQTLNRLLFPGPTKDFTLARETYGDVGRLDTLDYLYGLRTGDEHTVPLGRGVSLILGLEAIGNARRARHAHGDVHDQRSAPTDPGARHLRSRSTSRRPRRPTRASRATSPPRSPAWSRWPWPKATGRGRSDGGHHRGDEDGGGHHHLRRRHDPAARARLVQQVEGGDLVLVVTPGPTGGDQS